MARYKLILVDKIKTGYYSPTRYRLVLEEGLFWWKKTRTFLIVDSEAAQFLNPQNRDHRKPLVYPVWYEVSPDPPFLFRQVEEPMLAAVLSSFLIDAKLSGEVK